MLSAYFSRLEHVLVLLLAFGDYDPQSDDLARFIGMIWSDKFKRLLKVDSDLNKKRIYDDLRHIKEYILIPFLMEDSKKQERPYFFMFRILGLFQFKCHSLAKASTIPYSH